VNKIILRHRPIQLENKKWQANFELEFDGAGERTVRELCEPREGLTYHTREGAKRRDRQLAENWVNLNAPEWALIERVE
jgi:hypothetical protein